MTSSIYINGEIVSDIPTEAAREILALRTKINLIKDAPRIGYDWALLIEARDALERSLHSRNLGLDPLRLVNKINAVLADGPK
jgi:hypothetical protein